VLLLVHKAHATLEKYDQPNIGRLLSPRQYSRASDTADSGRPWAADNDAFLAWDEGRYFEMLDTIQGLPGCLFVTAPDVVGDAAATDRLYPKWADQIAARCLPVGYVAQDGCKNFPMTAAALFIGGTTEFKLSVEAANLARDAKWRGKWVHMGRVNTWRRLEYAKSIGVDSVDGTSLSMYTDTWLPRFSEMASAPTQGAL
jgi:hypothetical protein